MSRFVTNRRYVFVLIAVIVALVSFVATAQAAKVQLPEGTEIKVKFPTSIKISSGVLGTGVPLLFYVDEDVMIGGKTIIEKGAEGTATVTESVKSRKAGKPGKIVLEFGELTPKGAFHTAENGPVKLAGTITAEGKGKKILSYLFIAGLFIKGGQGEISPYKVYTATIAETVILQDN